MILRGPQGSIHILPVAASILSLSTRLFGRALEDRGTDGDQILELGITYRGGPLAPAGLGDGPQPGDRAPDAPCHDANGMHVHLFDLRRGPHWTLLGFSIRPPQPDGPVRAVSIGEDIIDASGHAQRAYAAANGELVLIRPDGHIGLRSRSAAEIGAYLKAVLPPDHSKTRHGSPAA